MSNQVYVSATFLSAYQMGQPEVSYPIPQDVTAQLMRVTYQSNYANYSAGALDNTYVTYVGGVTQTYYQVFPGEIKWKDGPLVTWDIVYATVPTYRSEGAGYEYYVPGILDQNTGAYFRWPQRKVVESRIAFTYYHTTTPFGSVTTMTAFQIYLAAPSLNYFVNYIEGSLTTPSYASYFGSNNPTTIVGTEIVVEPTTFKRWYGNIWEAQTRYVIAQ